MVNIHSLLRVGSNSCFPFISSFICLHVFSSPSSFVSVLQDNRSSLSSDSDRAHFVYLLRHKGTFPGFWGRLMVRNCATNWLAYVLCVRGYFALISLALILKTVVDESKFVHIESCEIEMFIRGGVCTSFTWILMDWVYCKKSLDKHLYFFEWKIQHYFYNELYMIL